MLFFITSAAEGSAIEWAHDHRLHHKHVDSDKDPYNVEKGLWYAHFTWMLEKKNRYLEKVTPDLLENKLAKFQHDHYGLLFLISNVILTGGLAWWTGDVFGSIVIGFLARIFFIHHSTWFINSIAHYWGTKPFSKEHSAVNNFIIAILTWGEGYHNYHHTFEGDYRNGVWWWQFDPTKALIWILEKLGLAKHLNKVKKSTVRKAMLMEDKQKMLYVVEDAEVKKRIKELHQSLTNKLQEIYDSKTEEVKEKKKQFKKEWKEWTKLCEQVLSEHPEAHHH